ncbi:NAD(P)H-binding protein [Allokutzneria sp. A3M-2-11 16]|uniref:NmrA family NAD(P)-binding protein n=1 Tax=Allokutzneria sp. A3M-2-11 16 TaxID=2962043 RepID=UPI0020B6F920|nr:NAD(P)H-binding protein [Allokutzneria sp. A3M-2-11 16]MCP3802936.1 NAD(P)H-binding protein [Allokutzneria sp. A3M-2-11 16]
MQNELITVMGATGNTGSEITKRLLAAGHRVRALGRSQDKLAELATSGAETAAGDATDKTFLTEAFRGSAAVYTLLPTDVTWADYHAEVGALGSVIVEAVRVAGVSHVVALSSLGADLPTGTGFLRSLHDQEQRWSALSETNVLLLRPGLFFESFHAALGMIEAEGVIADSLAPDLPIPMIAARDIAEVAATALAARDWTGTVVRELLGSRDLSYREATSILGAALGHEELPYIQFDYEAMTRALTAVGFSQNVANQHVAMTRAMNEGRVVSPRGRTPVNTTPTRFEDFAAELAEAHRRP